MATTARARHRAPAPEELARIFYLAEHREQMKKLRIHAKKMAIGANDLYWTVWTYTVNLQIAANEGAQTVGDYLDLPASKRLRYNPANRLLGNDSSTQTVLTEIAKLVPAETIATYAASAAFLRHIDIWRCIDILLGMLYNALPRLKTLRKHIPRLFPPTAWEAIHSALGELIGEIEESRDARDIAPELQKRADEVSKRLAMADN